MKHQANEGDAMHKHTNGYEQPQHKPPSSKVSQGPQPAQQQCRKRHDLASHVRLLAAQDDAARQEGHLGLVLRPCVVLEPAHANTVSGKRQAAHAPIFQQGRSVGEADAVT